jgi:hypothetical protein
VRVGKSCKGEVGGRQFPHYRCLQEAVSDCVNLLYYKHLQHLSGHKKRGWRRVGPDLFPV